MVAATLKDWFNDSFSSRGSKKAISFLRGAELETEVSYHDLNQGANRCAHRFLELGVEKGDRVVLFLNKSLIFVVAHLALQKIGAIAVPLNPGFKKSELDYLLHDADPRLVISDLEKSDMISKIVPNKRLLRSIPAGRTRISISSDRRPPTRSKSRSNRMMRR